MKYKLDLLTKRAAGLVPDVGLEAGVRPPG
jgi:hypothetical protein